MKRSFRAAGAAVACLAGVVLAAERTNPLDVRIPGGVAVTSCADPTVIRGQQPNDDYWYMYCTADPLHDADKNALGGWNYHLIPIFRSLDLVHWTYVADALGSRPGWAEGASNIWAPEIQFFRNKYYLYFAATDSRASISGEPSCADDSAIGVASSSSPTGPFTSASVPVVYPRRSGPGCSFHLTIDPEVILDASGTRRIYYGNFNGGIETRTLSANGQTSDPASAVQVVRPDIGEAPEVVEKDGLYYLFFSSSSCCSGPLSGYTVFAGRAASPVGPFVDRSGASLVATRAGGTPVLGCTGNRWIGPGHNTVFADEAGQFWTIYHAIDLGDPYFAGAVGFTKRPAMLDPLDWIDGWPSARGGWWVSSCRQPSPAAQPGEPADYGPSTRTADRPGAPIPQLSDDFDGGVLGPQWSWIREPAPGSFGLAEGALRFDAQAAELYGEQNSAGVLVAPAPPGEFVVETRVRSTVPDDGSIHNYTQAGLVVYGDDDHYVKLVVAAIGSSRQTEFAKEDRPAPTGQPFYGGTRVGPPADWTWLRIVRQIVFGGELYTAYSSVDGASWVRGGTWRATLGVGARIGLVSMSGAGFTAHFDFVRTAVLAPPECADPLAVDPCDDDGDGLGDACDPDDDGDALADAEDCAAADPAQGQPAEVTTLSVTGAPTTTISWPATPRADSYDVLRGAAGGWTAGDYGACLYDDTGSSAVVDPGTPVAGAAFFYLVRGVDAGCGGPGSYGAGASGAERVNTNPDACP